jgi:hypothetical protein
MGDVIPLGQRDSNGSTVARPDITLEWLLDRVIGEDRVTAAQRAIARVAGGKPLGELWSSSKVRRIFGEKRPAKVAPKYMVILAGIRGAKSIMAACQAIVASQVVPVEHLAPGDEVRIPILSTDVDLAHVAFSHLLGIVQSIPELSDLLVGKPKADSLELRHPSGKPIEIKVTAMSRAGTTLVARWLAGCIFDEAPRMLGDGSVKSLPESLKAISGRMLPGAQIWMIGSPHAPFGPVYDIQAEHFGKPTEVYCVVRAQGPDLNPEWWTPERCNAQRLEDEDVYKTDVLAEFADPEECLISSVDLEACTRTEPAVVPPIPGVEYVATMDPATRGNGWTLHVIGCRARDADGQPLYHMALARQWMGSKATPLSPRATLKDIAKTIEPYGLTEVTTDQWSVDALRDLAELTGLTLREITMDSENRLQMAKTVAMVLRTRRLELPTDKYLRNDLLMAKNRVTQNGATLVLPKTGDGRHCDHLPPLMFAMAQPPEPPEPLVEGIDHGEWTETIERLQAEEELGEVNRAAMAFM